MEQPFYIMRLEEYRRDCWRTLIVLAKQISSLQCLLFIPGNPPCAELL